MKNKIFMLGVVLLSLLVFNNNAKAACSVGVYVGDEMLCLVDGLTSSNQSNTAYVKDSRLVLNNYNGGRIRFYSGMGSPFSGYEIELIGDNYITNENGYGVLSFSTGVNFIGDGTLTIKSKMPFVSSSEGAGEPEFNFTNNVSTMKITVGENEVVDEPMLPDNVNEEILNEKVTDTNNLTTMALIISSCISMLCLIIIVILVLKNNKLKNI